MNELTTVQALDIALGEIRRSTGYAARREMKELREAITDARRLELYGFKVYSQCDEDGIIHEIYRRLNIENGRFIEIGIGDGLECNSFYLLHKGWSGTWIEANLLVEKSVRDKFAPWLNDGRLVLKMEKATVDNINDLVNADCDLLSIDVDGMDIHLLRALRAKPKVIVIEYNAKFPPPLERVPVYDPNFVWKGNQSDYSGSSLASIDRSAFGQGYFVIGTNIVGSNAFLLRNDLFDAEKFMVGVDKLYNPPRYWLHLDGFWRIGHDADMGPYE